MKNRIRFWSNLIVCLPLFAVLISVDYLPSKIPTHFLSTGQVDQFTTRPLWLNSLLDTFIIAVVIRTAVLIILTQKIGLSAKSMDRAQLLSAVFVVFYLLLFISDGLLSAPILTNYLPILVVFFSAATLYFLVPKPPTTISERSPVTISAKQLAALHHVQLLARMVTVRVNILAGLVMLLAESKDRWTIGILANLLAFASLLFLSYRQLRKADS